MAFVRNLLERLRHPGMGPRGPRSTLSGHVEELWVREEQSHRRQSQREQTRLKQEARPRSERSTRKEPKPETVPPGPGILVEGEAGRRWVPRS